MGEVGSRVKRPLILQTPPRMKWQASDRGCANSFFLPSTRGQGSEQRHFSLMVRQRGRILWDSPLYAIKITKATKSKSKKQFQHGVRTGFSLQQYYDDSSAQCSRSVVSDSLWPHRPQHAGPPCPSPTPGACSNSCPLSRWCHPTITTNSYE